MRGEERGNTCALAAASSVSCGYIAGTAILAEKKPQYLVLVTRNVFRRSARLLGIANQESANQMGEWIKFI